MADLLGYGLALLLGDGLTLLLRLEVGDLPRHLRALLTRHLLALGPGNLDISVIDTRFGSIFFEPGSGQKILSGRPQNPEPRRRLHTNKDLFKKCSEFSDDLHLNGSRKRKP